MKNLSEAASEVLPLLESYDYRKEAKRFKEEDLPLSMMPKTLKEIFRSVIRRQEDKVDPIRSQYGRIEKEEIDMSEKTLYVEAYAKEHKTFSFRKLLEKQKSRAEIIVTFLIILELMKTGKIKISQENLFDDILITSCYAEHS